jgi:UDP-N-acetylglucosamine--N-acetylmuramyl-(pentapeptide) pyrophosphoryl-undecaprenol N-acetylglucosamine transferase
VGLRVLIAGGGTVGHIIPALAIARELGERYAAEVDFLGTPRGLESRLVPAAGYRLHLIEVGQLKNVALATRLGTLAALPRAYLAASGLLARLRPQVVIGVGGYASGPGMIAALLRRIPTLAFEPNAYPGLANRLVGRFVSRAAVNFEPAARFFRSAEVTGIPVRREFFELSSRPAAAAAEDRPEAPRLLVFGGSQGARILNQLLPQVAPGLLAAVPGLTILHQAGERQAAATEQAYAQALGPAMGGRWQVRPFLDDMPQCFARASLIVSRSGASTVAELAASGKPAILIPFAAAADDHQRRNAEVMKAACAAELLLEKEATPDRLLALLEPLLADPARLAAMGAAARTLAHPDAAVRIAAIAAGLAGEPGAA